MEDFITEIYKVSFIIENLKEFIFLLDAGRSIEARVLYNKTAEKLEEQLNFIARSDEKTAVRIQTHAIEVKNSYDDPCLTKGLIEGCLLPELYSYISIFNTIDVSEGLYRLKSSDTGFLTVINNITDKYMHSPHDPMWEAFNTAQSIYDPCMENFLILGSGLGYLAYQIYNQSNGAIKIFLYEEDKNVLEYAKNYGVLSLIPSDNIEIIHTSDIEALAESLINKMGELFSYGLYISPFKKSIFDGACKGELNRIIINHEFQLQVAGLSDINLWKNKKLSSISFSDLIDKHKYREWIVVSAGPSLEDNLKFVKENIGKKGIIAVNTVLRRILKEGIIPDIVAAADQFPSLVNHIIDVDFSETDLTLVADWLLSWKYTSLFKGKVCFVRTNASFELTKDFVPDEPVWNISGTVAALAVETAVRLNANTIYLVGQDLAYPGGRKYADGMPHSEAPEAMWKMQVPSVDGSMVDTCEAFDWFRKALEFQISNYPDVKFINMSNHGAFIKGAVSYKL